MNGCDPLTIQRSIIVFPPSCTASDKVHAGTVCGMRCDRDGTLSGSVTSVTCLDNGRWSEEREDIEALRCEGIYKGEKCFIRA